MCSKNCFKLPALWLIAELLALSACSVLGPEDGEGNILISLPDRWNVKLESGWDITEAFGGLVEFPDETLGLFYRVATGHDIADSELKFARSKDKYGWEWNTPVVVDAPTGIDVRNGCVGIGANGDILGVFRNYDIAGSADNNPVLYYSQDFGVNWNKLTLTTLSGGSGHGNVIERDSDYLASLYTGGEIFLVSIAKDFSTHSLVKTYSAADLDSELTGSNYSPVEPVMIKVGNTIFGVIRNNNAYGFALEFYSTDDGATWSALFESTVNPGRNTPWLYSDGEKVYWTFPGRGNDEPAYLNYFYAMTYKPVNQITSPAVNWIQPKALFPIGPHHDPAFDGPKGNFERGQLFERNESLFLMWSEGNYNQGESIHYIKNIGRH